jgi:hypothetical protein
VVLLGADVWAALIFGASSTLFTLANNTVLAIAIWGAANLRVDRSHAPER